MNSKRSRAVRGLRWSGGAILSAALVTSACGSSSNPGSQWTGDSDGAGGISKDGGGDGVGGDGTGNSTGGNPLLQNEGPDATVPVIQPDAACGESTVVAAAKTVNILLVIDESGSMTSKPSGFAVDKWSAMKSALGAALGAVKSDISFGLELFPYPVDPKKPMPAACSADCCQMPSVPGIEIPVAPGAKSVPAIVSALSATSPGGGTPTELALSRALDYFTSGAGSSLPGDRYVLLATDGGPDCSTQIAPCGATKCTTNLDGECPLAPPGNCCDASFGGNDALERCLDESGTDAQIRALAKATVKTFVVGIPGSEAYGASLDLFARSGGVPNPSSPPAYYAVDASGGTGALTKVLENITKSLVTTCRLQLGSEPQDPSKLNVRVDGTLVRNGTDGWKLDTGTSPPTVVLQGKTCTQEPSLNVFDVRRGRESGLPTPGRCAPPSGCAPPAPPKSLAKLAQGGVIGARIGTAGAVGG